MVAEAWQPVGGRKKLRDHIFKHKHELQREMEGEARNSQRPLPMRFPPARLHLLLRALQPRKEHILQGTKRLIL